MKVYFEKEQITKEISFSGTMQDFLTKIKINPETVLITRDDEVLTGDELLNNKDKLEILSVISGG